MLRPLLVAAALLLTGCIPAEPPESPAPYEGAASAAPLEENATQAAARSEEELAWRERVEAAPEDVRDFIGRSEECARWPNSTVATREEIDAALRELRCNQLTIEQRMLREHHAGNAATIRLLDDFPQRPE